ncbi:PTS sugar transporter subunit IIC [Helcococcus kunzii]|uniref:PTS sugar transporter subunit IIC n=1 Tax=Helcococcus kunzii TaxID=40091 RepID=UPI001BB09198|nr:PTS sugar transporter subunit IIC [Helcococcus kunzii]QUY64336.1 PTS transporter subunit IIC [Helcococcus kunzii]
MTETKNKETVSSFILKILNGTTIAIVVALIPNAILATFLKPIASNQIAANFLHIVQIFQFFTPIMAGFLIAMQFKFNPIQSACVGGAAYIGSGAWKFVEVAMSGETKNIFQLAGIGDVINTMLTAALAVLLVQWIGNKLGSLNLVFLPIIVGTGVGFIGTLTLPYVSMITSVIGQGINSFTTLQPILMSILIAISFSIIIISPISTVAIGLAIGLDGLASASAGMGVAAAAAFLVWATMRRNGAGVPIAIGLGAMKMMMPNFLTNPIIGLPVAITAAISAISIPIIGMVGTPASAGFGLVGLVSPLAALNGGGINVFTMILTWIVIPFGVGFIVNKVMCDVLHVYDDEIFVFKG